MVQQCHTPFERPVSRAAWQILDTSGNTDLSISDQIEYSKYNLGFTQVGHIMRIPLSIRQIMAGCALALLIGCGQGASTTNQQGNVSGAVDARAIDRGDAVGETTIWDAFRRQNTETVVSVNKYIWSASLEVLEFLPVQSVDPFTGVIITGFGTPPGGGRAYRATVLINDPALDARSLNVSLQTRNGPASAATVRAVEDAILTRARQIRIADGRL